MKSTLITVSLAIIIVIAYYFGKRIILKPNIEAGAPAFEIEGKLPDGSHFSLKDLRGKYVLLDFWGSWCKPCRESNPSLVKLYNEFRSAAFSEASGFEIVSYGVERDYESWKAAIAYDGLSWPYQLASINMFNAPAIKKYNVKQIPTKFLINPEGRIIAVDPTVETIQKLLTQYSSS